MIVVCMILFVPLSSFAQEDASVIEKGATGQQVIQIQQRLKDLGYLNYRATGKFSDITENAVRKFQSNNSISPDGKVGTSTLQKMLSNDATRCPINPEITKLFGPGDSGTVSDRGALSNWESIGTQFSVSAEVTVTDLYTGQTYSVTRTGGVNCAQVVTTGTEDFATYTETFGGGESWEHRSVLVRVGAATYAASIFGMPTGGQALNDSGMKGYTILYFNNSKTDILSFPDEEARVALTRAATK